MSLLLSSGEFVLLSKLHELVKKDKGHTPKHLELILTLQIINCMTVYLSVFLSIK